jgi:hypothetical protein
VGLLSFAFLSPGPSIAQESCDSLIANLNRVADQITDARKKAEDEDECHAEAAAWAKAGALIEQRIALRQKAEKVCGDALENGVTVDRLRESLKLMRKFEADAKDEDDCKQEAAKDTKPTPNTPVELNTELTPSGTIPCFGGGTCKSSHDNRQMARRLTPRRTLSLRPLRGSSLATKNRLPRPEASYLQSDSNHANKRTWSTRGPLFWTGLHHSWRHTWHHDYGRRSEMQIQI